MKHLKALTHRLNQRALAIGGLAIAPVVSFAQTAPPVDVTAATGGVSAAQTAVLAVLGAMIVMMAIVWATRKVLRLFGR